MKRRRVLVAPLDWGLGHATRCIPIIRTLLDLECEVQIGGSGQSLKLLQGEFPLLTSFELPGYNPVYPRSGLMMMKLALQSGKFFRTVLEEQAVISKLIRDQNIDLVISDNRYGCYAENIPCVFITHQLKLLAPPMWSLLGWVANFVTGRYVNKFTECWVPDFPGSVLTGSMSAKAKAVKFIGPLSRFTPIENQNPIQYDVLALISGPEPQRTVFEELVTDQLVQSGLKAIIVRGVVDSSRRMITDKVEAVDHLESDDMAKAISQSGIILCRSGYSTIMDLIALRKKAILVPTPGQTEQEYLAHRFKKSGIAYADDQSGFSLNEALMQSDKYSGFGKYTFENRLKDVLIEIFRMC